MKSLLVLFLMIGLTINAQSWVDGKCNQLSDVTLNDFKNAKEENRLQLIINQEEKLVANGQDISFLSSVQRKEYLYNFIMNPDGQADLAKKPDKAFIRVRSFGYPEAKKRLIDQLRDVYYIIWTDAAVEKYAKDYVELACKKRNKIQRKYPYQVIERIEKRKKGNKTQPPTPMTAPSFKGDVSDN